MEEGQQVQLKKKFFLQGGMSRISWGAKREEYKERE